MSRKTHSNPPSDTGGARCSQVLIRWVHRANTFSRTLLRRYPIPFLCGMVVSILLSGILAFTIMRTDSPLQPHVFSGSPVSGAGSGIREIVDTYGTLREVSQLQERIAQIIAKDTLGIKDSLQLIRALQRFEQLQQSIPHIKNSTP